MWRLERPPLPGHTPAEAPADQSVSGQEALPSEPGQSRVHPLPRRPARGADRPAGPVSAVGRPPSPPGPAPGLTWVSISRVMGPTFV